MCVWGGGGMEGGRGFGVGKERGRSLTNFTGGRSGVCTGQAAAPGVLM